MLHNSDLQLGPIASKSAQSAQCYFAEIVAVEKYQCNRISSRGHSDAMIHTVPNDLTMNSAQTVNLTKDRKVPALCKQEETKDYAFVCPLFVALSSLIRLNKQG